MARNEVVPVCRGSPRSQIRDSFFELRQQSGGTTRELHRGLREPPGNLRSLQERLRDGVLPWRATRDRDPQRSIWKLPARTERQETTALSLRRQDRGLHRDCNHASKGNHLSSNGRDPRSSTSMRKACHPYIDKGRQGMLWPGVRGKESDAALQPEVRELRACERFHHSGLCKQRTQEGTGSQ